MRRWAMGWVWWLLAVVITLASARWQRMTGPTYPVSGTVALGGAAVDITLTRTHAGVGDQPVRVLVADAAVAGEVTWRRYPTGDSWESAPMARDGDWLQAVLPHQPPAGKLEYRVRLTRGAETVTFPARPAVTRFKSDVPAVMLVPHIVTMFAGMLLSTRAGLAAATGTARPLLLARLTLACIVVGGFIFGPVVLKYAFDTWWTGVPIGWDITDNKTLVAGLAWGWAVWRLRGGRPARGPIIAAAVITLVVFAIPHSLWGSQIDWQGSSR